MKSLLVFMACLFTIQAYAQQEVKTSNTSSNDKTQVAAVATGDGSANTYVKTFTCPETGVKVTLSGHPPNAQRSLSVTYIGKQFYGTASTVQAEFPALNGLPQNIGDVTSNSLYKGVTDPLVTVKRIDYNPEETYCGYQGTNLSSAIGNEPHVGNTPVPVYKVTVYNDGNQWNSGTVVYTDGSNLDYASATSLIIAYNNKRNLSSTQAFPESCRSGCYNNVTTTGPDSNAPSFEEEYKFDNIDASGKGHNWGENDDNDSYDGNPGNINPVFPSLTHISLDGGVISHAFGSDNSSSGYVNSDFGGHFGVYVPITRKIPISFGWNTAVEYTASRKENIEITPEGYPVGKMPVSVREGSEEPIRQSLFAFETGPQLNFMLGRKIAINAIIQGGIASFKQDGFKFIQELQEGDRSLPIKIFDQQEIRDTHFFWTPKLRIFYALTSQFGIWAAGNYRTGQIEVNQSRLNIGTPLGSDGTYTFSQVQNAKTNLDTKRQHLNGMGFGFGITFSLSKK